MNSRLHFSHRWLAALAVVTLALGSSSTGWSQSFDFDKLNRQVNNYAVVVKIKLELSFGMQTNETEQRLLGTIVTEDGLVMFDGSFISDHNPLSPTSSFGFRSRPTRIEIITLDEKTYPAEYVGVDRQTRFAFARIVAENGETFSPVKFVSAQRFRIGDWVAAYMLLPDFVKPPLAADIGMISNKVQTPEEFALIVGFSPIERASPLFNDKLQPVGMLGSLTDPSSGENDAGMGDGFGDFEIPLLGIITAERIEKLIADPPEKGKADRAWLGITLQALTPDIAAFLKVDSAGGIIVNEVMPNSPAADAGLVVGDIIYRVNNEPIEVDREEELPIFQRRISNMGAGATAEFSVLRPTDNRIDTLMALATLRAAPLAASDAPEYEDKLLEFKARDLVFTDYMVYNVDQGSLDGVVVSELSQGGLATIAGMQIGDVIQQVDGQEVSSVEELEMALDNARQREPREIVFFIWRFNKTMFLNVKTN